MVIKQAKQDRVFLAVNNILLGLFLLIVLYPIWIVVVSSISTPASVAAGKVFLWPVGFSLDGYRAILDYKLIVSGFGNSLVMMISGTVLCIVITLLGGYPLSRRDLAGKKVIMFLFTFTMYFGGGMIPFFMLIRDLGLMNSLWSLILPSSVSVWNMILMKTFFQTSVPEELLHAARIDGCDDVRYLISIGIPLAMPIIAVLGLFTAVGLWNSYFNAMLFINDTNKFPLQLVLRDILIINSTNTTAVGQDLESLKRKQDLVESLKYSVIVASSLPLMILYPFVQKFFVKGLVVGSLKG